MWQWRRRAAAGLSARPTARHAYGNTRERQRGVQQHRPHALAAIAADAACGGRGSGEQRHLKEALLCLRRRDECRRRGKCGAANVARALRQVARGRRAMAATATRGHRLQATGVGRGDVVAARARAGKGSKKRHWCKRGGCGCQGALVLDASQGQHP
eukprot:356333-Chlamydomonas_euryale.AAC.3